MKKDMTGAAAQPAVVAQAQHATVPRSSVCTSLTAADHQSLQPSGLYLESSAALAHTKHADHLVAAALRSNGDASEALSSSHELSSTAGESDDDDVDTRKLWSEKEALDPEALKAARKAHKAVVKETNRERRKQKMKKHTKKRAVNKHKHK